MKNKKELSKIMKKARADGAAFELRTRKDLTDKGWTVDKFGLNVEFNEFQDTSLEYKTVGKLIQAKVSWRRTPKGMFPMGLNSGFPDFIAFRMSDSIGPHRYYEVIGVECKVGKYLDQVEKSKCRWYLKNNIFSRILIAFKTKEKNRIKVNYMDFKDYDKKVEEDVK